MASKKISFVIGIILIMLVVGGIILWQKPELLSGIGIKIDRRILLTPGNLVQYTQCHEEFNNDQVKVEVFYSNPEKGVSFNVPYNSNWGNKKFKIEPYWESNDKVSFGPIGMGETVGETCTWKRSDAMYFLPQYSAEATVDAITKLNSFGSVDGSVPPGLIFTPPTIINLNGLTVVKYATNGPCSYPALRIIGKKYNYEFAPGCGTVIDYGFRYLEDIVKSVKLID